MAFEDMKAAAGAIPGEIAKRPEDRRAPLEQSREKIAGMQGPGMPAPGSFRRFEDELREEDAGELFDSMPV